MSEYGNVEISGKTLVRLVCGLNATADGLTQNAFMYGLKAVKGSEGAEEWMDRCYGLCAGFAETVAAATDIISAAICGGGAFDIESRDGNSTMKQSPQVCG